MTQKVDPFSFHARGAGGPSHGLGQAPRDGEAKPRPAKLARGGAVALREALEEVREHIGTDAEPRVVHRQLHQHVRAVALQALRLHHYAPLPRELDRVSHEVDEDLPDAPHVAVQETRTPGVHADDGVDLLLLGAGPHELEHVLDRMPQVERGVLELELPRLDLGEVEDVVDDREERLA